MHHSMLIQSQGNFDPSFFQKNLAMKLPVYQNGSHILYDTIEIIQYVIIFTLPNPKLQKLVFEMQYNRYIDRVAMVSGGGDESTLSNGQVVEWIYKVQPWNPEFFTLSHVPLKYRLTVSKFLRRVLIARMAEYPELARAYYQRRKVAYEKLGDADVVRHRKEHVERILDEAENKLFGEEIGLGDAVFMPILSRLVLLKLEEKYIGTW